MSRLSTFFRIWREEGFREARLWWVVDGVIREVRHERRLRLSNSAEVTRSEWTP